MPAPVIGQGLGGFTAQAPRPTGQLPGMAGAFGVQSGPFSGGRPVSPTPGGAPGMTPLPGGGNLSNDLNPRTYGSAPQAAPQMASAAGGGASGGAGGGSGGGGGGGGRGLSGSNPMSPEANRNALNDMMNRSQRASEIAQANDFANRNSPFSLLREKARLEKEAWERERQAAAVDERNAEAKGPKTPAGLGTRGLASQQALGAMGAMGPTPYSFDPILGTNVPNVRQTAGYQRMNADGSMSNVTPGLINDPNLERLRGDRMQMSAEGVRGATMANDANQVKLDAMRQGALWNRANAGNNVDFTHSGDGVTHSIGSGGGGGGGSRSGSGGGAGAGDFTLDEIMSRFSQLLPQSPLPREASPTPPPREGPIAVADRKAMNAAQFGQAKDKVGRMSMSALNDVRNQMTSRGIGGSGIEGRLTSDVINAGYGRLGDVATAQTTADTEIEQDVADRNAQLGVSQRGQDIGLMTNDYNGRISQRGQDASTNNSKFNSILSLINHYGGRLY